VESLIDAPEDVILITRMLNDQSGLWKINKERCRVLSVNLSGLSVYHKTVVREMLDQAERGDGFWHRRAEYLAALSEISRICLHPSAEDIESVLTALQVGAAQCGVQSESWVKRAEDTLQRLARVQS
jgi:hypothetical protein